MRESQQGSIIANQFILGMYITDARRLFETLASARMERQVFRRTIKGYPRSMKRVDPNTSNYAVNHVYWRSFNQQNTPIHHCFAQAHVGESRLFSGHSFTDSDFLNGLHSQSRDLSSNPVFIEQDPF